MYIAVLRFIKIENKETEQSRCHDAYIGMRLCNSKSMMRGNRDKMQCFVEIGRQCRASAFHFQLKSHIHMRSSKHGFKETAGKEKNSFDGVMRRMIHDIILKV
jgi:hypothetical protein